MDVRLILENSERFGRESHIRTQLNLTDVVFYVGGKSSFAWGDIRTASPGASVYSMTKAALTGLVRGAAIDLAPRAITVNNVQPGPTATDMSSAHAELVKTLIPLKRMGDISEVASFVSYLASEEAGFITGANLTIDGGYVA